MANIAYFEIPADNVDRAKHFYKALLGWKIAPTQTPMDPEAMKTMEYQDISTGDAKEGTMNMGGMYKRQMGEGIMNYAVVDDLDKVLAKVEKLGGKIIRAEDGDQGSRPHRDNRGLRRKRHRPLETGNEVSPGAGKNTRPCTFFFIFSPSGTRCFRSAARIQPARTGSIKMPLLHSFPSSIPRQF